ncbi:MAG: glycosyltransferase [Prevotellaceae bacterium]|jgi:glycosyltransferase involved in cell wall biosynthesis|nr:glycosyltransferase [Prevotellaceae bacterium]
MNIAIIGTAYPFRGGLAAFNERLAQQFIREGHRVEIYTFTLQYPSFLFPGKTQYSDSPAPAGLKIYRKINSVNPLNWLLVGRKIRKKQPDLAIIKFWLPFMSPCLGTIARIIRKNKHTKVVSILDNVIPHEHHFYDNLLIRYFTKSVDAFVAMSKSVLSDLALFDTRKPRVFSPHPLYDNFGEKLSREEALQYLKLDSQTRYMLFFGFIRHYKGLDLLMEAFADKRFRAMNVKLIVAGEFYSNEPFYRNLEKKLGLQNDIIWANDFIPDNEVRYYFSAADIVVQPYKSATQSGVTQIAYHFEKPMLVTNIGGLAEIVPDGKVGYVVEPLDRPIADALVDFLKNERNFSENIKAEKEKYSWQRMTEKIIEL